MPSPSPRQSSCANFRSNITSKLPSDKKNNSKNRRQKLGQCFDTVGWASVTTSNMKEIPLKYSKQSTVVEFPMETF